MRWVCAGTIGLMMFAAAGSGEEADEASAIVAVIEGQFSAFAVEDESLAYSYASPLIRKIFVSPENFGQMVRNGYPMIWAAAEIQLLGLRNENGRLLQRIVVTDQAGAAHLFDYEMVEVDGSWLINGVFPVKQDQLGV